MTETFHTAVCQCDSLCTVVEELRMTVVEDHPLQNVVKLVEDVGDRVEELLGATREMQRAVKNALSAVEYPTDTERAHHALSLCRTNFKIVSQRFFGELAGYETVNEIVLLGQARNGEWHVWAELVKESISKVQLLLLATGDALAECWQALSEAVTRQADTVQNTS